MVPSLGTMTALVREPSASDTVELTAATGLPAVRLTAVTLASTGTSVTSAARAYSCALVGTCRWPLVKPSREYSIVSGPPALTAMLNSPLLSVFVEPNSGWRRTDTVTPGATGVLAPDFVVTLPRMTPMSSGLIVPAATPVCAGLAPVNSHWAVSYSECAPVVVMSDGPDGGVTAAGTRYAPWTSTVTVVLPAEL